MVALTTAQISALFQEIANLVSRDGVVTITKTDIKNAITDINTWMDANQTSFNNAINATARAGLTTPQKAYLLAIIALKKYSG
mgnify:CR=1 FL=1